MKHTKRDYENDHFFFVSLSYYTPVMESINEGGAG